MAWGTGPDMTGQARLLRVLSDAVNAAPPQKRSAVVRAAEASLSSLGTSASLPLAARWLLKTQTVRGRPNAGEDFWASRVTPKGATELRGLVARFVVLYAIRRTEPSQELPNMSSLNADSEKAALYLEDLRVGQRFLCGTHRSRRA